MLIRRRIPERIYVPRIIAFAHCSDLSGVNREEINTREGMYGLYPGDVIAPGKNNIVTQEIFGYVSEQCTAIIIGTSFHMSHKTLCAIRSIDIASGKYWCIHPKVKQGDVIILARYGEKYFDIMQQVTVSGKVLS